MKNACRALRLLAAIGGIALIPACHDGIVLINLPGDFQVLSPADAAGGESLTPTLTWSESAGASSYTVQLDTEASFSQPLIHETAGIPAGTTQFLVPPGLLSGLTTYFWRVRAVNPGGALTAGNAPFRFTTDALPSALFSLTSPADAATGQSLTPVLTWSASGGASSYTVQLDTEASFSPPLIHETTGILPGTTQFTVPPAVLLAGVTYFWRVKAVFPGGTLIAGNAPFQFTTDAVPPYGFSLSSPADGVAGISLVPLLSWTDSANEESYTVQIDTDPAFAAPLVYSAAALPANTTQRAVPAGILSPGTLYYWRVIAVNSQGSTTATNAPYSFSTDAIPSWFNLTRPWDGIGNQPTANTLEWTNPTGETSFTVQVDTESTFAAPLIYEASGLPADTVFHTLPIGLLGGPTTYYWRVIAHNATGDMVAANAPFSFVTTPAAAPFTLVSPADLATNVSLTPTLSWTASSGHVYYTLHIDTDPAFQDPLIYSVIVSPGATSSTVPPGTLQPATPYYWRVIATTINGGLALGGPFRFTTQ